MRKQEASATALRSKYLRLRLGLRGLGRSPPAATHDAIGRWPDLSRSSGARRPLQRALGRRWCPEVPHIRHR